MHGIRSELNPFFADGHLERTFLPFLTDTFWERSSKYMDGALHLRV